MIKLNKDAGITKNDYAQLFSAARKTAAQLDIKTRLRLIGIYRTAAAQAAEVVQDALERGLSSLTEERWAAIQEKLTDAADALAKGTESEIKALIKKTAPLFPEVDAAFIWDTAKISDADRKITKEGLGRIVASVSKDVIDSLASRMWQDGYTFSDRIWGTGFDKRGRPLSVRGDWQERIKMTVAAGIAQGRDPAKIAKDIQVYTADGKIALSKRWGSLERGTAEFAKRLPGRIDWRAQRLVRSELYASLQDAQLASGRRNPASTGLFDWVLSQGRQHWECECESLAAGSPYKADNIPTYPHANCLCSIRPRLMDLKEFVSDLTRWAKGSDVEYIDTWYRDVYAAAA